MSLIVIKYLIAWASQNLVSHSLLMGGQVFLLSCSLIVLQCGPQDEVLEALCIATLTSSEVAPSALVPLSWQARGGKLSSLLAL